MYGTIRYRFNKISHTNQAFSFDIIEKNRNLITTQNQS